MTHGNIAKQTLAFLCLLMLALVAVKPLQAQDLQVADAGNARQTSIAVEGQNLVIYLENKDGTNRQRVTSVPMNQAPLVLDDFVALAADGKSVVYATMDNPFTRENTTIWAKQVGESDAHAVVNIPNGFWMAAPIWSPDSQQLLYIQESAPLNGQSELELWLVDRAGGEPQRLWQDNADNRMLLDSLNAGFPEIIEWSRDGKRVSVNNQSITPPMLTTIELMSRQTAQQPTSKRSVVQSAAVETSLPCDVPLFHQTGNQDVMQTCNNTISSYGCALTSTAMVFKYFGVNTDPSTLNRCLGQYACPIWWGPAASNCSEGKVRYAGALGFSYATIDQELAAGRPVILGMDRPDTSHFIVIKGGGGGTANGYSINDPARYNPQRQLLSDYLNNGWRPGNLYQYSGTPACTTSSGDSDGGDISYGQTKNGTINPSGDTDDYYLNVAAGDIIEIRQNKNNSQIDSYVELYDPDDRLIVSDDDAGGNQNSFLRRTLSIGGRYRIRAKGYPGYPTTGAYGLSVMKVGSEGGSNNSCGGDCEGDPRTITFGQTLNGTISPNNDRDTYYFSGTTGKKISIRMNRSSGSLDSYLELWSPNGVKLIENDDGGGNQNSWIAYTLPSDGTYRISAYSYSNGSSGTYSLKLESVASAGGNGNYARSKPVRVSSVEAGGLEGWKATDGNNSSRWSSRFSDPQWIYVDLGQDRTINQVILKWETAYAREYGIYVQSSGMCNSCWTNVYYTSSSDGGTDTINFSPIRARYVLMSGWQRGTPWGYSLWEFEVYDTSVTPLPEVPPDDETKAPNSAPEALPLAPVEGDKDVVLSGDGELGQENTPLASNDVLSVTEAVSGTQNVVAFILSPDQEKLYRLYTPADQIRFKASASSYAISGTVAITAYEWRSDLDGVLGDHEEFLLPITDLSLGSHTISLRAQNEVGEWSEVVTTTLLVEWPNQIYLPVVTH